MWLLVALAAVVVFCGGGGVLLGVVVWNQATAPVDAASEWLDDARVGDVAGATNRTCADSSAEELIDYIETFTGTPITEFTVDNVSSSGEWATVDGIVTGPNGPMSFSLGLVDEDGWKVCEVG
jgi:hypothetical protein